MLNNIIMFREGQCKNGSSARHACRIRRFNWGGGPPYES